MQKETARSLLISEKNKKKRILEHENKHTSKRERRKMSEDFAVEVIDLDFRSFLSCHSYVLSHLFETVVGQTPQLHSQFVFR